MKNPYDNQAFDDPVLQRMWVSKGPGEKEVFATATLTCDAKPIQGKSIPAGTRVFCSMVSRFGDVGIRADRIDVARNGYDIRVPPEWLTDIVEVKRGWSPDWVDDIER